MPAFSLASRSPWRAPALSRLVTSALLALLCAATLTGLAAALVWHPLLILIAVPIAMGWIAGLGFGPLAFLCFVAATAGFGFAWVEGLGLTVVGRAVNPNGLHWGVTFGVAGLLLARFGAGPLPKLFRPYAAFVVLSAVGLAWAPDWFDGLKQVLLYGLPLLLGWLTYRTVRTRQSIEWLTRAWWAGLAFSSIVALAMAVADLPSYSGLGGVLGSRSFALHLLPFFALALAGARERLPGRGLLAAAIGALALLTLSRMVVAVMLALGFFAFVAGRGALRVFGVLGVVLLGYLALQFQPLRERIFVYQQEGFTGWKLEVVGRGSRASSASATSTSRAAVWPGIRRGSTPRRRRCSDTARARRPSSSSATSPSESAIRTTTTCACCTTSA